MVIYGKFLIDPKPLFANFGSKLLLYFMQAAKQLKIQLSCFLGYFGFAQLLNSKILTKNYRRFCYISKVTVSNPKNWARSGKNVLSKVVVCSLRIFER